MVTAFWEHPTERKAVVSRQLMGKTLSMCFRVCMLKYLVPFQSMNLSKTQTSEKKGVFPQGSTQILEFAVFDWSDWQTLCLL